VYNRRVPAFIVPLPGADMASGYWILPIVTGGWSVEARLEQYLKGKAS